jgi:glycosyltransferase involved in cell wall biosynthesis
MAYRLGSVPEIIDEGTTGFLAANIDEAVEAVERIGTIDRAVCRQVFEERFGARRMALHYVDVYRRILRHQPTPAIDDDIPCAA